MGEIIRYKERDFSIHNITGKTDPSPLEAVAKLISYMETLTPPVSVEEGRIELYRSSVGYERVDGYAHNIQFIQEWTAEWKRGA